MEQYCSILVVMIILVTVMETAECHESPGYHKLPTPSDPVLDAGIRIPRGLLDGNFADFGNYYQCLGINEEAHATSSTIEGKYCMINLPLAQDIQLPSSHQSQIPLWELNAKASRVTDGLKNKLAQYNELRRGAHIALGGGAFDRAAADSALGGLILQLAVCIPKTCTTQQAFGELSVNLTELGLRFDDYYCRLPNDKRWVAVDYVAIALFSFLGLLLIPSTSYDVYQTVILGNDPKRVNKIYQSFSVYTNSRRLVTYNPVPGAIECLDGVRSLAMMWVIIGHTYANQVSGLVANPLDVVNWMTSPQAIWVTLGPITVDTFFLISGLLLVYTTAGKLTSSRLLKSLHLFYLNRLLRMFPVLAAFVLIQASFLHRLADGPNWNPVQANTERCRVFWWSTLLHIQNWVNPINICLGQTWYLAIDVQLYIISPLVLFWVLGGKRRVAWIALSVALILSLVGSTVFNFIMEFQSGLITPSRDDASHELYTTYYYMNTLTRSSPFFVGMIYGYVLHLNRHERLRISAVQAGVLWSCAVVLLAVLTYIAYPIMQLDWDNQMVDSLVNSFMRPCWALAVGWIILACHQGYGGPINWVLTLRCFKVLGRLSYAMYIVHYTLITLVNSTAIAPAYFSPSALLFKFLADFTLATVVAYLLTLLVDSPCSTLIKHFMGGGQKKPQQAPPSELKKEVGSNGIDEAFSNDDLKKVTY